MDKEKLPILFLQLPRPDADIKDISENIRLAGIYLGHSIRSSAAAKKYKCLPFLDDEGTLDDKHILGSILRQKPSVIAFTLYLWNIERSLCLARAVKKRLKTVKIIAGGPEVEHGHPFLFKNNDIDILVTGEGESVFPQILEALSRDTKTDLDTVFWQGENGFRSGKNKPPYRELTEILPPPQAKYSAPDKNGIAWMETVRGCPLRCSFCAYGHGRRKISYLQTNEVKHRISYLIDSGAKTIRFIDPTFNANPCFKEILFALKEINRMKKVKFFAELCSDMLTREEAYLLAAANFTEIEAGIQSRNKKTLSLIGRPSDLDACQQGIRYLLEAGIKVTIDLMFGLPGQSIDEIKEMLEWAKAFKGTHIQCLDTLLLPGTELREKAESFGLKAISKPPYNVIRTPEMGSADMNKAAELIKKILGVEIDTPTTSLIGSGLPDLYPEKIIVQISSETVAGKGKTNRRAVIFKGADLFKHRALIARIIKKNVSLEPHILWQFVLEPEGEEPAALINYLARAIKKLPEHFLDRCIHMHAPGKACSRRLFIRLKDPSKFGASWVDAAENILRKYFH